MKISTRSNIKKIKFNLLSLNCIAGLETSNIVDNFREDGKINISFCFFTYRNTLFN